MLRPFRVDEGLTTMGLGAWRSWIQSILLNSFHGIDVWSQEGSSKRVLEVVVKNEEVSVVG